MTETTKHWLKWGWSLPFLYLFYLMGELWDIFAPFIIGNRPYPNDNLARTSECLIARFFTGPSIIVEVFYFLAFLIGIIIFFLPAIVVVGLVIKL